jgi:HEPN domain-containing protein
LIRIGWELEKTHDLERLLQCLGERNSDLVPAATALCDALVDVYFINRYPGFDLEDPDWPKLRAQVAGVTTLLETVKARLPAS